MANGNLGFFLGGVAQQRNKNRELSVIESRMNLEKQTAQKAEVEKQISQAIDLAVRAKSTPARNPQAARKVIDSLRTAISGFGADAVRQFDIAVGNAATPEQIAVGEANAAAAGAKASVDAAGSDPVLQESLGVRRPDPSSVTLRKDGNFVTIPDVRSSEGAARFDRLTAAGYSEFKGEISADSPGAFANPAKAEVAKFREAEVSGLNALDLVNELQSSIDSDAALTGLAQSAFTAVSGGVGSMKQLVTNFGGIAVKDGEQVDESELANPENYDLGSFKDQSLQTGAFKSNVVGLAYMLARSLDPAGRVSDADVQNQIDSMAADSGNKDLIRGALGAIEKRLKASMRNRHRVFSRSVPETPPLDSRFGASSSGPNISAMSLDQLQSLDVSSLSSEQLIEADRRFRELSNGGG